MNLWGQIITKYLKYFILLELIIIQAFQAAGQEAIRFKHFSIDQGLSQSTVTCILKDRQGFMWFGTRDGLNRFDGYNFVIYRNNPAISSSVVSNYIYDLFEDKKGNLWIGTNEGLDKFDRSKDEFVHFNKNRTALDIRDIIQDSEGKIWIATYNEGLCLFNENDGSFKSFKHDVNNKKSISSNELSRIVEFSQNELWIVAGLKLNIFNRSTQTFTHVNHDSTDKKSISYDRVTNIYKDNKGNIWISLHGKGISKYDRINKSYKDYLFNPAQSLGLSDKYIVSLGEGSDGKLWIGTENKGLCILDQNTDTFTTNENNHNNPSSLSYNHVSVIYRDDLGNMWLGTWSGGVNLVSRLGDKFALFTSVPGSMMSLGHRNVVCIMEDKSERVWIGTAGGNGGLNLYDKRTNTFTYYLADSTNKNSVSGNNVRALTDLGNGLIGIGYLEGRGVDFFDTDKGTFLHHLPGKEEDSLTVTGRSIHCIVKDSQDYLWIGTWGYGVNIYNPKTKTFTKYRNIKSDHRSISSNVVFSVYEDKEHGIWLATEKGLNLYDRKNKSFIHYLHDKNNINSISHNTAYYIHEDKKGNFWVATFGGLNLFDKKKGTFTAYTEKDGFPSNVIKGILEDKKGNLWLSSNKGIIRFNPETKAIKKYDVLDGLQSQEFHPGVCYVNKKGEMYFGGINGFNLFHPDSIKENKVIPQVILTDFKIFNKSVTIGIGDSPLYKHISETEEIKLSYWQSVFSIEYAGLNFTIPEKNQYAYKLDGFDKEWNYVGTLRAATYTNLDPGEYTFRVRASNNDGVWNKRGTSIKIIITPPFWQTIWFRALVSIVIIGSAYSWYKIRINAIKRQKEILEYQVIERTAEISLQKEELATQAENLQVTYLELASQTENLQMAYSTLTLQKEEIEKQGKKIEVLYDEVKESIRAAQMIQQSILPSDKLIKKYLPESFILYRPKDVVSGDFYWFDVIQDKIILAAVDCTGHGVSGALMAINGHHLLNQSIYSNINLVASEVLDRLNKGVIKELHREDGDFQIYDGMDIALCIIDMDKKKLQYSGANNPLYILRNDEVIQIKANKFAIGLGFNEKINKFTNNEVELQSGDIIYIFSDGYADQIGGDTGYEKFLYQRFRELIIQFGKEPLHAQGNAFNKNLNDWMKDVEQLDDILLIGFKLG